MVVVFAGAGASYAVSSKKYPTTVEFFDRLPDSVTSNDLFEDILEYLEARPDREKPYDIEQVLWALQELESFAQRVDDDISALRFLLQGDRIQKHYSSKLNTNPLAAKSDHFRDEVDALIEEISSRVFELYAEQPDRDEVSENWIPLLKLLENQPDYDLFTVNYDTVIETTVEYIDGIKVEDGRRSGVFTKLDLANWSGGPNGNRKHPILTKVHGSIHWAGDGREIFVSDPGYRGARDRHALIYPGYKATPEEPPFSLLFEYFENRVAQASVLLFIGYSFRDAYINRILEEATPADAEVLIINPEEELPSIPYNAGRYTHYATGFDRGSVEKVSSKLDEKG